MLTSALILMLLIGVIGSLLGVWLEFYESRKQITQFYESIRFFNLIQEFRLPFTLLLKYWKSEEYCPYNDMNFVLGHCAATKASGNNFY